MYFTHNNIVARKLMSIEEVSSRALKNVDLLLKNIETNKLVWKKCLLAANLHSVCSI